MQPSGAAANSPIMNDHLQESLDYNRRDFLRTGSLATLMAMLGGVALTAPGAETPGGEQAATAPKLKVAVIGLGPWGREVLNTLLRLPQADVAMVCDCYPAFLKRGTNAAPGATGEADYTKVLANPDIKAVVVATPTHQHKDIVLAALKARKHVYCEAPLAHTIEDAKAIAAAAKAAEHLIFQPGLQMRVDPQRRFLIPFVRSGATGQPIMARAQHHKKHSWRTSSSTAEREKEVNWRLDKSLSLGLAGELGIHPIDQAAWFLNSRPKAVTGFGDILFWKDGRDEPDTVQAVLEFANGVNMVYHATLANSFESDYEVLYGSDSAIMLRESNAWLFKEVDSPLLGWEVYAKKETFQKETGIVLKADASKSSPTDQPAEPVPFTNTPLSFALGNFIRNAATLGGAAEDYVATMGADDKEGLATHLKEVARQPAPGYPEGLAATVAVIKAHEAILARKRVEIPESLYELA